ncbi:MAG: hypothetical protein Hals2KO_19390 [Halioglobus sp.]
MPEAKSSEETERQELLEALQRLEASRPDKIGLAGDLISTGVGVAGGVAASGTLASAAGMTTIFGSSTLGGALGGVFVATTPVGWVVGAGLAGGALAYGATRLIRSGEASDHSLKSLYSRLKAKLPSRVAAPQSVAGDVPVEQYEIEDEDAYYDFIARLTVAVDARELKPERAERLLAVVTSGEMKPEEAVQGLASSATSLESGSESFASKWFTMNTYREMLDQAISTEVDPELDRLDQYLKQNVPRVWLLGKTGAGKSSLVAEFTGQSDVEIGNGFQPCTAGLTQYAYPVDQPILEFLDTRGLSEAGYVADSDIETASEHAHAIVVVIKVDDPEQSAVWDALSKLDKSAKQRVVAVYTLSHGQILNDEVERAVRNLHKQLIKRVKAEVRFVVVDFPSRTNVDQLRECLAELMPSADVFLRDTIAATHEEEVYLNHRAKVLWHSGAAASADIVPGVGLVAVPGIQLKMLYQLAEAYGLDWGKREITEFISCLGAGFSVSYGSKVMVTQLGRLIPVWGQTIGQATAVALSFGLTFALGRAACYYMYRKRNGQEVDNMALETLYREALKRENLEMRTIEQQ